MTDAEFRSYQSLSSRWQQQVNQASVSGEPLAGWKAIHGSADEMGDAELTDTPALLARLEAALAKGEAEAARLDRLAKRHKRLDSEARATLAALDTLIEANAANG